MKAQQVSHPPGLRLLLADQLVMLAFSPGDGRLRTRSHSYLTSGLAGAVLTELALRGCVAVEPGRGRAGRYQVRPLSAAAGDPFLDAMAARIRAERPRPLSWWIKRGLADAYAQVLHRLRATGMVTTTRGALRKHNYLAYPQAQAEAYARLQQALLANPARVTGLWTTDPWSASLVSLAFACHVMEVRWLPRDQRGIAKTNLRLIQGSDPIGQAVAYLVEQSRAARSNAAGQANLNNSVVNTSTFG
jgi:hypothetical protein